MMINCTTLPNSSISVNLLGIDRNLRHFLPRSFWELLEILDPFHLGISRNSWELLGILDPCNLGISGNFCKLIGILDSFYLKIFGNIWES